jgi:Flp pilus assembly protein CpaB
VPRSRRARAIAFTLAALLCAFAAASIAARYRSSAEERYGPLKPVLVATAELPPGQPIGEKDAGRSLAVRRVPASFVPPGALRRPEEAIGQAPGAAVPAGSYVLAAQLSVPTPAGAGPEIGGGDRPVQVAVTGAEALTVGGASPEGMRVDVVISQQPGLGDKGKTEVEASGVQLLALSAPQEAGEGWNATLAVSEDEALELIDAEAAGRLIRLLPR